MRKPLDHACHRILGTTVFAAYLVADIHNVLPVFRSEILVGRLGYEERISVAVR
jgi:hypothetical protein